MQDRKILTLNECLELKRQLTLQEMVDLSIEDYKQFLFAKRIIKYMPDRLEDYVAVDEYDGYYPHLDIVLELKNPKWEQLREEWLNSDDDAEPLYESEDDDFDTRFCPEIPKICESLCDIVEDVNGKLFEYYLTNTGTIYLFNYGEMPDGKFSELQLLEMCKNFGKARYLETNYEEYAKQRKKLIENYKNQNNYGK